MPKDRPIRVLVVDDVRDAAESLARLLEVMGCEARFVTDPTKAMDAAEFMEPDVVFLDIGMPGLDGHTLARTLRSRYGDAMVLVAVTGHGSFDDRTKSREAGIDAHVEKPIDGSTIEAIVATVLSRR